jgi:hypothetical protein
VSAPGVLHSVDGIATIPCAAQALGRNSRMSFQFSTCICACRHGPLCRHHHHRKQAEGWRLEQPEPGVLVWHTPAGRTYITAPTQYAI